MQDYQTDPHFSLPLLLLLSGKPPLLYSLFTFDFLLASPTAIRSLLKDGRQGILACSQERENSLWKPLGRKCRWTTFT